MLTPRSDHYVPFRHEETIAEIALAWRREARNENNGYFDVVDFVQRTLSRGLKKGLLRVCFFTRSCDDGNPAYVEFDRIKGPTLFVDEEIWELAQRGDPMARFIVAHEIGHLVLHDHYAQAFSNDPAVRLKYSVKECSAEWQANVFASCFLLPDHIVTSLRDVDALTGTCSVTRQLAEERLGVIRKPRRHEGDACPECMNFTLVRNGVCMKCDTCGHRTEDS
jgi:hypothetical protein